MQLLRVIVCIFICILSLGCAGLAHAQQDSVPYNKDLITRKSSTIAEIGLAFLKITGNYPDLSKIVEDTQAYKNLSVDPVAQQGFLRRETDKLQATFVAFTPKKTPLTVRFAVKTVYNVDTALGSTLTVKASKTDSPLYLPIKFMHYPIAVLFDQIELFETIPLSPEAEKLVVARMPIDGALTLLMEVYPVAADDETPITYDGLPQYPLLTEIGYIGLINNNGEQVWAWKNDKYNPRANNTLATKKPKIPLSQQIPKLSPTTP